MIEPFSQDDKLPDNTNDVLKQQPQEDTTLSDDLLTQNKPDIGQMKPFEDNKTQNIQLPQVAQNPQQLLGQEQEPLKEQDIAQSPEQIQKPVEQIQQQEQQPEQPKFSQNLSEYIDELLGKQNTPVYPENGVLKGGVEMNNPDNIFEDIKNKIENKTNEIKNDLYNKMNEETLDQSGGYVKPENNSRDYNLEDISAVKINDNLNKKRPDAKQMLEIGIYGVNSYKDNDQFKHIKDGSADLYNEKYKLTGNKTIPSDMKGIEFTKDSEFSKRVSENEDFQKTVKDAIKNNNGKMPDKVESDFNKDSNLNYSIGHGTLLNPKVTEDGYIEGIIFDKYDYDKKLKFKDYKNSPFLNTANNSAEYMHRKNKLEYYYYFVPVRFKY